eukprot:6193139-Pleurochrysis_carterae.AAC.1
MDCMTAVWIVCACVASGRLTKRSSSAASPMRQFAAHFCRPCEAAYKNAEAVLDGMERMVRSCLKRRL